MATFSEELGKTSHYIQKYVIMIIFITFFLTKTFRTTLPQIDTTPGLFVQTRRGQEVLTRVKYFMKQHILPAEKVSIV